MIKRIVTAFAIVAAALALSMTAQAQNKKAGMNSRLYDLVQAAREGGAKVSPAIAEQVRADFADVDVDAVENIITPAITGAWNCNIATSDTGLPPFKALQTFGSDGTFVETSDLLGMGGEGPAHGAYERTRRGYALTFELFVFDPMTGESVGHVRVRASIRMTSSNDFNAVTAVDFIELDGTVIEDIDGGPYTGRRLHVRAV